VTLAELAARPTAYLGKPIETVGIPSYAHDLMFLYDGSDFVFVRWDVPNIRHCLRKRVIANGVVEKGVARNRHGFLLHVSGLRDCGASATGRVTLKTPSPQCAAAPT
jgi:hypothetical protein